MEFDALGEQSVLKNIKQGAIHNEAKRQAAFRWLSEQTQLRDRRETRIAQLAWGCSLYQWRRHLSASWVC
jgi:hypothetical protein